MNTSKIRNKKINKTCMSETITSPLPLRLQSWSELRGPTEDFIPAHELQLKEKNVSSRLSEPTIRYIYDNEAFYPSTHANA